MKPQNPKEKDLKNHGGLKLDQEQGGNKVYINEYSLTSGKMIKRESKFFVCRAIKSG